MLLLLLMMMRSNVGQTYRGSLGTRPGLVDWHPLARTREKCEGGHREPTQIEKLLIHQIGKHSTSQRPVNGTCLTFHPPDPLPREAAARRVKFCLLQCIHTS